MRTGWTPATGRGTRLDTTPPTHRHHHLSPPISCSCWACSSSSAVLLDSLGGRAPRRPASVRPSIPVCRPSSLSCALLFDSLYSRSDVARLRGATAPCPVPLPASPPRAPTHDPTPPRLSLLEALYPLSSSGGRSKVAVGPPLASTAARSRAARQICTKEGAQDFGSLVNDPIGHRRVGARNAARRDRAGQLRCRRARLCDTSAGLLRDTRAVERQERAP